MPSASIAAVIRSHTAAPYLGAPTAHVLDLRPPSRFAESVVRHHIHVMAESYETRLAKLNEIIERYRAGRVGDRGRPTLTREDAILLIKALGFTEGDAMRWLDAKPPRR